MATSSQPSPTSSTALLADLVSRELRPTRLSAIEHVPKNHVLSSEDRWLPCHRGQVLALACPRRIVTMASGTQGGKTITGPVWLLNEILRCGPGDYLAVTATYDLFKLKMLPALLALFEGRLGIGRYWTGDRLIELRDPSVGTFWAKQSSDPMWGRIILRSAESKGGLESGTAKAAWCDEVGQGTFGIDAWRAILRRLAIFSGRILNTTTLYDYGWFDVEVLQRAERGGKKSIEHVGASEIEITDNRKANITTIQFDSILNPLFPKEEFDRARDLLPDDEFQAYYRGRRVALRLMVFDCFDLSVHLCKRFSVPREWPAYVGLDFGGAHTAAQVFREDPGTGTLYWTDDYLAGGRTSREHVTHILSLLPGQPSDCRGGSRSEEQWRQEFRAGGLSVGEPAVSAVDVQVQRMYAILKSGGLRVFDDLSGVVGEVMSFRRKRDRQGNVTDEIEDESRFHRIAAARYILSSIRPGLPRAKVRRLE